MLFTEILIKQTTHLCCLVFLPALPVHDHPVHLWLPWLQAFQVFPDGWRDKYWKQRFLEERSARTTPLVGKVPTFSPGDPVGPRAPGGPNRVRLLIGQPWEHLAWMEAAYWES